MHPPRILTSVEFLDHLRAANGGCSDYRVAQVLGLSNAHVSNIRTGKRGFGAEMALVIAEQLGLSDQYVLACLEHERAQSERLKQAWAKVARGGVAALALLIGSTTYAPDAAAQRALAPTSPGYTLGAIRRRRGFKAWAGAVRGQRDLFGHRPTGAVLH